MCKKSVVKNAVLYFLSPCFMIVPMNRLSHEKVCSFVRSISTMNIKFLLKTPERNKFADIFFEIFFIFKEYFA
jgi:hypothetical protein